MAGGGVTLLQDLTSVGHSILSNGPASKESNRLLSKDQDANPPDNSVKHFSYLIYLKFYLFYFKNHKKKKKTKNETILTYNI